MDVKEFVEARLAEYGTSPFDNPIRVIRTVAAIQRVMVVLDSLADYALDVDAWGVADGVKHAYNALAWIWRDHPDHDPSWAPDGWLQVAVGGDT